MKRATSWAWALVRRSWLRRSAPGRCWRRLGRIAAAGDGVVSPRDVRLRIKPVMTNIVHTGVWEGPCRWKSVSVEDEAKYAETSFANWSKQLKEKGLGRPGDVELLEPAHITFSEKFIISDAEWAKLAADSDQTDAYFVYPSGSSVSAYEIAARFGKPILLKGLGCRNVDIAAYTKAKGSEAFVAADEAEFNRMISLLRARKVFRETRVLFPTDRGLPAVCSVGSIWDVQDLQKRLGVAVTIIPYRELGEQMGRTLADASIAQQAEQLADELRAQGGQIVPRQKVRRPQPAILSHDSRLDAAARLQRVHDRVLRVLFQPAAPRVGDHAVPDSLAAAEPGARVVLRRRLGVAAGHAAVDVGVGQVVPPGQFRSARGRHVSHQSQRAQHEDERLRPAGRSVPAGTIRRVGLGHEGRGGLYEQRRENRDASRGSIPTARKLLVLKGQMVGSSGWNQDLIGCSVEAVIKPPEGRCDEFLKKRLEYGNHLQWVYGDCSSEMREAGEMLGLQVEVIA